jgi:hypothetical protein
VERVGFCLQLTHPHQLLFARDFPQCQLALSGRDTSAVLPATRRIAPLVSSAEQPFGVGQLDFCVGVLLAQLAEPPCALDGSPSRSAADHFVLRCAQFVETLACIDGAAFGFGEFDEQPPVWIVCLDL